MNIIYIKCANDLIVASDIHLGPCTWAIRDVLQSLDADAEDDGGE